MPQFYNPQTGWWEDENGNPIRIATEGQREPGIRQNWEPGMNPAQMFHASQPIDMFASMQPSARAQGWRNQWNAAVEAAQGGGAAGGASAAVPSGGGGSIRPQGPTNWWEAWQPGKIKDIPEQMKSLMSPEDYKLMVKGLTYRPPWMMKLLNNPIIKAGPGRTRTPNTGEGGPGAGASGWWNPGVVWNP